MVVTTHSAIQLRYSDVNQQVVIDDPKGNKLVTTVAVAIEACKASGKAQEFTRRFQDMQDRLAKWLTDHHQAIDEAYITVRDSAILFLVVQKSVVFDQALEDSLTDLDLEIAQDNDLHLIRMNVLAIPKASKASVDSLLVCGGSNL